MSSQAETLIARRVELLPKGLCEHIYRVRQVALELARCHSVDEEKAGLGALAHDIARAMKGEQLLQKALELGVPVHPVEARLPVLLHGPVGAELLRREEGLDDLEVYEAVYWHSTAHEGLGSVAKVVFLADKLDPMKSDRYPYLPELRGLAMESLDRGMLDFLDRELATLLQQKSLVHPAWVEARNELILKRSSRS